MAKNKELEQIVELKREITCLNVTLGLLRGALTEMDKAVESKDKERFRDCMKKFHAHLDRVA
jgi:hypothetical protein